MMHFLHHMMHFGHHMISYHVKCYHMISYDGLPPLGRNQTKKTKKLQNTAPGQKGSLGARFFVPATCFGSRF